MSRTRTPRQYNLHRAPRLSQTHTRSQEGLAPVGNLVYRPHTGFMTVSACVVCGVTGNRTQHAQYRGSNVPFPLTLQTTSPLAWPVSVNTSQGLASRIHPAHHHEGSRPRPTGAVTPAKVLPTGFEPVRPGAVDFKSTVSAIPPWERMVTSARGSNEGHRPIEGCSISIQLCGEHIINACR